MMILKNINKYYPMGKEKFHALNNIDLAIGEGEFVAVQGKSGAGKSTLLHIMGCLDGFDSGSYTLNGKEANHLTDSAAAKIRNEEIGFVLQDFSLINQKTVLFNVMLPLYFSKMPYGKMKGRAREILKKVGIEDQERKKVNQLSGGQKQRVAIARALVNDPQVILADEPTGALDSKTSIQIMELLSGLNAEGMTVVIVTHDDMVASYCKRHIVLSDGEIIEDTSVNIDLSSS